MDNIKSAIENIKNQIDFFTEEEKRNFCEDCLRTSGDTTEYNAYLTDFGACYECGYNNDVVNVKIANLVLNSGIEIMDYFMNGGIRVYPRKNIFQ